MNEFNAHPSTPDMNAGADNEVALLRIINLAHQRLSAILEAEIMLQEFVTLIHELTACRRVFVLLLDRDSAALEFGSCYPPLADFTQQTMLQMLYINTYNAENDPIIAAMLHFQPSKLVADNLTGTRLEEFGSIAAPQSLKILPLVVHNSFMGALILDIANEQPLSATQEHTLETVVQQTANHISNARQHSHIVQELATTVHEMSILQQIDAELNDTIDLKFVFGMILDWALRFTNADAATLALYDASKDELTIMAQYGNLPNVLEIGVPVDPHQSSITARVARGGKAEVVPDVLMDKDYFAMAAGVRSMLSVPITREDTVIGVLTLQSKRVNGFTEGHLNFTIQLAARAGVAVDNARLFTETKREREKLALILRNITDIVIVIDTEGRIILLNRSAADALNLATDVDYNNRRLSEVITDGALQAFFMESQNNLTETNQGEFELPNQRTYHTILSYHKGIGWILVMQDITSFKEMDRLKSELVANVSHDLKQPLSIMRGYIDLLQMTNDFDERSLRYIASLDFAFRTMRQLIDDLLEMGQLEHGVNLAKTEVQLARLLERSVEQMKPQSEQKSIIVTLDIPPDLPLVLGDETRLQQIFDNLISNAVKYTLQNGTVSIRVENTGKDICVYVRDTGMGISPDNQKRIWDRFFRVRSQQTEGIEGTGLGLAIVKSLVEAHNGTIDLTSQVGVGTTFTVNLPLDAAHLSVSS